MARYFSKIDVINKFASETQIPVVEKIGSTDLFGTQKTITKYIKSKPFYCNAGDELEVCGDCQEWMICVVANVKGKPKERFSILVNDIKIIK